MLSYLLINKWGSRKSGTQNHGIVAFAFYGSFVWGGSEIIASQMIIRLYMILNDWRPKIWEEMLFGCFHDFNSSLSP